MKPESSSPLNGFMRTSNEVSYGSVTVYAGDGLTVLRVIPAEELRARKMPVILPPVVSQAPPELVSTVPARPRQQRPPVRRQKASA